MTDYLYVTLPFQNKKGQFTTPSPTERVERAQLKRHVNERAFASVSHQKMFTCGMNFFVLDVLLVVSSAG